MPRKTEGPVQIYRGTPAQNNSYTGAAGELTYSTGGAYRLRVHDGTTAGGIQMVSTSDLASETAAGVVTVGDHLVVHEGEVSAQPWVATVATREEAEAIKDSLAEGAIIVVTDEPSDIVGVPSLSDSVSSGSSTTAASSKAVKTAYDAAVAARTVADSKVTSTTGNIKDFYMDAVNGSDSNDGLTSTTACKTWAGMQAVLRKYGARTIPRVTCAEGVYSNIRIDVDVNPAVVFIGANRTAILEDLQVVSGAVVDITSCTIRPATTAFAARLSDGSLGYLRDCLFTSDRDDTSNLIYLHRRGECMLYNVTLQCSGDLAGPAIKVEINSVVQQQSALSINVNNASSAVYVNDNSSFICPSNPITINGTYTNNIIYVTSNSVVSFANAVMSGSPTGKRYYAGYGSILSVNGRGASVIPGTEDGSVNHYSTYI